MKSLIHYLMLPGRCIGFLKILWKNPTMRELNAAFKLYEKRTGKSRNVISPRDINIFLDKVKG